MPTYLSRQPGSTGPLHLRRTGRLLTGVLAAGLLLAPVVTLPAPAAHAVAPELASATLAGVDVQALRQLGAEPAGKATDEAPEVLTPQRLTEEFDLIGVTWSLQSTAPAPLVQVRLREGGTWGGWQVLETEDAGPDLGTAEYAGSRLGTSPLLTAGADGYQVRVDAAQGRLPQDLSVELIDAGRSAADAHLQGSQPVATADAAVARPAIVSREAWGADESLRSGSPTYLSKIKVGVVHHTASTNSYTAAQAASQVRAIYAYHATTLGWSDIGYNYLVDKFGTVYEGRYGGVDRLVMGAHAGGYNAETFGISALGNYSTLAPPTVMVDSISEVIAWKLANNYIDPLGSSELTSAGGGTARYPAGDTRTFPNIIGHRQTGSTSCPGDALFNKMSTMKTDVSFMVGAGLVGPSAVFSEGDVRVTGALLWPQDYSVSIRDAAGVTVREKLGSGSTAEAFDVTLPLTAASGKRLEPGTYTAHVDSWAGYKTAVAFSAGFTVEKPQRIASVAGPSGSVALGTAEGNGSVTVRFGASDGSWSDKEKLGGVVVGSPALAYRGNGVLEVAVTGTNGVLYTNTRATTGSWSGWFNTGRHVASQPALVQRSAGAVDMLARQADGSLGRWSSTAPRSWTDSSGPGGVLLAGTGMGGVQTADGTLHVAVIGSDKQGWTNSLANGRWLGWKPQGGVLVDTVSAGSLDGRSVLVSGQGTNLAPYVKTLSGTNASIWSRVSNDMMGQAPVQAVSAAGWGSLLVTSASGQPMSSTWSSGWGSWTLVP